MGLLGNKRIMKQIDDNVENVGKVKKDKWECEAHLKRLKIIQAKKARSQVNLTAPEVPEEDMATEDNAANAVDLQKENAEDEKLTPEELQKKIDKTARKLVKKRDELA